MPRRRVYKATFRRRTRLRRTVRKRRFGRRSRITGRRGKRWPAPIMREMKVKMRYCERVQNSGGPAVEDFVYRGNSIFDPRFATGGLQPIGHDEYASLYERYKGLASKIVVTVINTDPNPVFVGITVEDDSTTFNAITLPNLKCRLNTKWILIAGANTSGGDRQMKTISRYYTTKKALPRGFKDQLAAPLLGANPPATHEWYWHVWVATEGAQGFDASSRINLHVEMMYYVLLSDPVPLLLS